MRHVVRARNRHGLTLFEVLIVIGLIGALFALVLPFGAAMLDRRSLEETRERVVAQALLARARSMRDARAIELILVPDPPRILARWFPPEATAGTDAIEGEETRGRSEFGEIDDPFAAGAFAEIDPLTLVPSSWAITPLGNGASVLVRRDDDGGDAFGVEMALGAAADDPAWIDLAYVPLAFESARRVAILTPDGRAIVSGSLRLGDATGRMCLVEFDAWSGRARGGAVEPNPTIDALAEREAALQSPDDRIGATDDSATGFDEFPDDPSFPGGDDAGRSEFD